MRYLEEHNFSQFLNILYIAYLVDFEGYFQRNKFKAFLKDIKRNLSWILKNIFRSQTSGFQRILSKAYYGGFQGIFYETYLVDFEGFFDHITSGL